MDAEKQAVGKDGLREIERIDKKIREAIARRERILQDAARFHYYIASMSGGAIVVSVTFMGIFQENFINRIQNSTSVFGISVYPSWFLFGAWVFLLFSFIASIWRNSRHMTYRDCRSEEEWLRLLKQEREFYTKEISDLDRGIEFNIKEAKVFIKKTFFWGCLASWCFPLGLISLIIFGILILS